jgi:hypothetical protein
MEFMVGKLKMPDVEMWSGGYRQMPKNKFP